jgi:aspartyl protease family protein
MPEGRIVPELSEDQWERFVYLSILLVALGSYALVAARGNIGTRLRHLLLWALLFTGVAAGYSLWDGVRLTQTTVQTSGEGMVVRRGLDGHFHLTLEIVGASGQAQPVRFIVDTGATQMVLTRADAQRLGYGERDLRFTGTAQTANGTTRTATVTLPQVSLAGHQSSRVRALVNEGELHSSLLGMGYLERFASLEITRDQLRIRF